MEKTYSVYTMLDRKIPFEWTGDLEKTLADRSLMYLGCHDGEIVRLSHVIAFVPAD